MENTRRVDVSNLSKPSFSWISLLLFVVGSASTFDVQLVGRVVLAEIIAFAFALYFWLTAEGSQYNGNFFKSLGLLGMLFIGICISDVVNSNFFLYSARAFARPIFMLGFFMFFIPVLRREPASINYYVYGGIIAGVVKYFRGSAFEAEGTQDMASYAAVSFRVVPLFAAVIIAAAVYTYPKNRLISVACLFAGAVVFVSVGAPRSSVLVLLVAASLIFLIGRLKSKKRRAIQLTKAKMFILSLSILVSLTSLYVGYTYAAPRGMLGEEQLIKYESQAYQRFGATPWGLMLSGRPQVYGAILGILERPLVGFGSWRHDKTSIFVIDAIAEVGADAQVLDNLKAGGGKMHGAGHSVLFQAWVENGVIPAIAYILIYGVSFSVFIFTIKNDNRMTPFIILTFISFSWDFLFSPPDMGLRFSVGLFLAIYTVFMDKKRPLGVLQPL